MAETSIDSARPPPGRPPLTELGPYRVLTKIEKGPVATGYLCRKGQEPGLYVLRVVHDDLMSPEWLVDRLLADLAICARIQHANVEHIADFGTTDRYTFVATRHIEGCVLSQLMMSQIEMPPRVILPLMVDVLSGLYAAHTLCDESGAPSPVVHSGVGFASILVGFDGIARVTELGIASVQTRTTQTLPGVRSDRFAHMAPEQIKQPGDIDHRADIFAVGTVLWSLLTGHPLFRGGDAVATMRQVLHMPVPPPSSVGRHPPAWLDDICLRALHKSAARRPASAEQLASVLKQAARNDCWASRAEIAEWVRRALDQGPSTQANRMSPGTSSTPLSLTGSSEGSSSPPVTTDPTPRAERSLRPGRPRHLWIGLATAPLLGLLLSSSTRVPSPAARPNRVAVDSPVPATPVVATPDEGDGNVAAPESPAASAALGRSDDSNAVPSAPRPKRPRANGAQPVSLASPPSRVPLLATASAAPSEHPPALAPILMLESNPYLRRPH